MKIRAAFAFVALAAGLAPAQLLTPAWVELGEHGQALARAIVASSRPTQTCPSITVDGAAHPMSLRLPVPVGFQPLCEFALPSGAKAASVMTARGAQALHLPIHNPSSIVVLGDTGCRIKGARVQDCNDMSKWPLQAVADSAANVLPDVIIHVGDYLYRESVCPVGAQDKCGGTPTGDTWDTWNADFFAPAAKLLAAAPWAFSRGNHEDCERSWRGWFYYLDPRPWSGVCVPYSPTYVVKLGSRQLVMLDSSAAKEDLADPGQVARFVADLRSLHLKNAWLVDHHPFWGLKPADSGNTRISSRCSPLDRDARPRLSPVTEAQNSRRPSRRRWTAHSSRAPPYAAASRGWNSDTRGSRKCTTDGTSACALRSARAS